MNPRMERQPLATALKRARTARGVTQHDVARAIGVSQGTVSLWERGKEVPTLWHTLKLLLYLPELRRSLPPDRTDLLLQAERILFGDRCTCGECSCHSLDPVSSTAR